MTTPTTSEISTSLIRTRAGVSPRKRFTPSDMQISCKVIGQSDRFFAQEIGSPCSPRKFCPRSPLLAVLARGFLLLPRERAVHAARIGKAAGNSHFQQRQACLRQKFLGLFNPKLFTDL